MSDWQEGRYWTFRLGQAAEFYRFIFEEEFVC